MLTHSKLHACNSFDAKHEGFPTMAHYRSRERWGNIFQALYPWSHYLMDWFHDFLCLWPIRHVTNWTTHSKHIMRSAHATNTLPIIKSITTLVRSIHNQIYEIAHSNDIGIVLLDSMCSNQRPEKNQHCLLLATRYCNGRPKKNQRQC